MDSDRLGLDGIRLRCCAFRLVPLSYGGFGRLGCHTAHSLRTLSESFQPASATGAGTSSTAAAPAASGSLSVSA
jgi:hypothetical protein